MRGRSLKIALSLGACAIVLSSCGGSNGNSDATAGAPSSLNEAVAEVEADILGVRLAMTPDEAETALEENMPDNFRLLGRSWMSVEPGHQSGPFSAETPGAYVAGLRATGPRSEIQVTFARPPAENLVESVYRKQGYSANSGQQTSLDVYRQSLIDKYGQPQKEDKSRVILLLKWLYPSSARDCAPLKSNMTAKRQAGSYPEDMGQPPEKCATALIYSLTYNAGIVDHMEAKLVNPGQEYLNREATIAYQDDLRRQAAAEAEREATDAPDL